MRSLLLSILVLFFTFCRNSNPQKEIDAYFEKEIQNRIETLDQLAKKDSLQIDPHLIDKQVNNLILLSKDIENLSASVNKANAFFEELSLKFGMNKSDFTTINTGMHVNEIASSLKQNELNMLNQLILKNNSLQIIPFTAQ